MKIKSKAKETMKKKVTAIALAVCILAVAVIGATMAYFTDTDSKSNTFTFGGVDIELTEKSEKDEQNKIHAGTEKDGGFTYDTVLPGLVYSKVPTVKVVEGPAWVVVTVTVPTIYDHPDFFNRTANETDFAMVKKVVGENTVYYFYANAAVIAENSVTPFTEVKINPALTQDDVKNLPTFNVVVNAYGIQKEGFDNAQEAFAKAFADKLPTASVVINGKTLSYDSLEQAITEAPAGATVTLEKDLELASDMTIAKDITLDGQENAVISQKTITVNAEKVTVKDLTYREPSNKNSNASCFYLRNGCKEFVIDGCTFENPQWEVVQVTSKDIEKLMITNSTFIASAVKAAADDYYNKTDDQATRYIHVQPDAGDHVTMDITITGNTFKNLDKVNDSCVGIYFIEDGSTLTLGNNSFSDWAEGDVVNGVTDKLSVMWPEMTELKTISKWTGSVQTITLQKGN